jgi:putative oxidoreductase
MIERKTLVRPRLFGDLLAGPAARGILNDIALLLGRGALAWVFFYYGAGKLFSWFHGPGVHQTAVFMANSAHLHPGTLFAIGGGVIEFSGSVLMAMGLGARLAGLALAGDMLVAILTVTGGNGFNSETLNPGYEFNMVLGILALVIVLSGPGRFSLDHFLWRRGHPLSASSQ